MNLSNSMKISYTILESRQQTELFLGILFLLRWKITNVCNAFNAAVMSYSIGQRVDCAETYEPRFSLHAQISEDLDS